MNDEPPRSLVEKATAAFTEHQGSLPEVYRAIVLSPEFVDASSIRAKFKSPFEFVISALRATDAKIDSTRDLLFRLNRMGQPLYRCEDPTGYFDQTEAWLDPGVLVHRWDFALKFTQGRVEGITVPASFYEAWQKKPIAEVREEIARTLVPEALSERAKVWLTEAKTPAGVVSLVLGMPAFQKQ